MARRIGGYDRISDVLFVQYGGKVSALKVLLSHIPYDKGYCEPFFGSGAVFFARAPSEVEVINDADYDIINFFSVLKDERKCIELERKLYWTPISRAVFIEARKRLGRGIWNISREEALEGDVERAYWWYILVTQSYCANRTAWAAPRCKNRARVHIQRVMSLYAFAERLRWAHIECDDGIAVCRRYDMPHMVFYLDPPYLLDLVEDEEAQYKQYGGAWGIGKYEELIEWCLSAKGSVVLSNYDAVPKLGDEHPLFKRLLDAGWKKVTFEKRMLSLYGKGDMHEALFINPRAQEKLAEGIEVELHELGEEDSEDEEDVPKLF